MDTIYFKLLKRVLIGIAFAVQVCYWNANKHRLCRMKDRQRFRNVNQKHEGYESVVEKNPNVLIVRKRGNQLEQSIQNNTSSETRNTQLAESGVPTENPSLCSVQGTEHQGTEHQGTFLQHSTHRLVSCIAGQLHLPQKPPRALSLESNTK